ncbi:hypothetical protein K502DRAFT_54435 [Neoconidiobolus thromboides FSU 785]|nr:hypothetical protein K502DRAFT_54435 [Neoconidiobolus thromboides FSU 785]
MSFFGGNKGADNDKKQQIMDQLKGEFAMANVQELITKLNDKCFKMCIPVPGTSFSSAEQTCVNKCTERYMEAWNLISSVYLERVQKESNHQHHH